MILKIFDERNDNYTFIDKVESVEVNVSDWCFHSDEEHYLRLATVGYELIDKNDKVSQKFYPLSAIRRDNINIEVNRYKCSKNMNVWLSVDRYFLPMVDRYKTEDVYIAKVLTVFRGPDTPEIYAIRRDNESVYLLNDNGKTIDRL